MFRFHRDASSYRIYQMQDNNKLNGHTSLIIDKPPL